MRRVGIIGGGLAGLTVAFRRAAAGDTVLLVEPSPRLGGQLWTERKEGFVVEHGAEGFVARSEAVPALAAALSAFAMGGDPSYPPAQPALLADLVGQEETQSYGFDGASLVALAPGEAAAFLGFQVPRDEMGKGIRTFRRGMGQIVEALATSLEAHADVRPGVRATAVSAPPEQRPRLTLEGGAIEEVDAVVVATGAAAASALLAGELGEVARALGGAPTLSSCTVTLAYPRAAVGHPLDGTGFVVAAAAQEHGFRACTFITSKLPDRAPEGHVSLRVFFRPTREDLASLDDAAWSTRAEACLRRVFPVHGPPLHAWVSRWPDALPVFAPGHAERVRAVEAALAGRAVLLAGSAFHGSGIDAAVRSAEAAARALSG